MYTGSYAMDLENMFEDPEEFVKYLYNIQEQEKREDALCECMRDENFIAWLESHTEDARFRLWKEGINSKKGRQWLYIEGLTGLELAVPEMKRRIQVLCAQVFKDMPEFWILQDDHLAFYRSVTEDGKSILNRKEELRSISKEPSAENDTLAVSSFRKMIENIDSWIRDIRGKMLNNYVLYQAGLMDQDTKSIGIECTDVRGYFVETEAGMPVPIGYLREKKDADTSKRLERKMDQINTQAVNCAAQLAKEAEGTKLQLSRLADDLIKKSKKPGRIRSWLAMTQGVIVMAMLLRIWILRGWDFSSITLNIYSIVFSILALLGIWQGYVANKKCRFWKQLKRCIADAAEREKALTELSEQFRKETISWYTKEAVTGGKSHIKDISYIQEKLPAIDKNLKKTAVPFVAFLILAVMLWPLVDSGQFRLMPSSIKSQKVKEDQQTDPKVQLKDGSSVNVNELTVVYPDQTESSSSLTSSSGTYYGPENLIDGDVTTSWQEGVEGYGEGEAIRFSFAGAKPVKTISINAGSWISSERYYANGRPKELAIVFSKDGTDVRSDIVTLEDKMEQQFVVLDEAVECDSIYIRIDSVYTGEQYEDTVIAEMGIYEN